ncbi:cathepsin L-like peptidase [Periplaneta americana]|uniref:cathepsin L-like peptidase n=1 Tax=Periplaneta americana TaxID=6978 RepID=UPI0037E93859
MRRVIIFLAIVAAIEAFTFFELALGDWEAFKIKYGKTYCPREEMFRMNIFLSNVEKIKKHNEEHARGLHNYTLGINRFADMLLEEVTREMNGLLRMQPDHPQHSRNVATFIPPANVQLPDSIDWREKGAVTPVKDQGHCGSCWAFSAIGTLEGQHFRKTGKLISLSEQDLVDCCGLYGTEGCKGGHATLAFDCIKGYNGIDTEDSYPYEAKDGTCRFNPNNVAATDVGYVTIKPRSESHLQAAVATVGPVAVSIFSDLHDFSLYKGGVFYNPGCVGDRPSHHAVTVIGYGTDKSSGEDYWLVKNSWGEEWGEGGYIRIARNRDNHCGIATRPVYPLV